MATVLIVEDSDDLREILSEYMLAEGVRSCVTAASLTEVEARAEAALAAGLAIIDVNLGRGEPTGVDVCRWLRERGFAAPIVFLTGHASSDPRVAEAVAMPNTRLLSKPIGGDVISQLVSGGR